MANNRSASSAIDRRRTFVFAIILVSMLGAIAFGTWGGFPVFDDASLMMLWQEKGTGTLAAANWHRPVCGMLLEWFVDAFGVNRLPYVILNLCSWILLAWQTYRLSLKLFSNERGVAAVSALLILSPIVVKTHYTTLTTLFPANIPVSMCLAVLLLMLRNNAERRLAFLAPGVVLTALAAAISEYAVATTLASSVLLFVVNRRRTAFAILAGGILGYIVFQTIGDFNLRTSRVVSTQFKMLAERQLAAVIHFLGSLWKGFIGAYGSAAGRIDLEAGSRSTIFSALAGLAAAVGACYRFRHEDSRQSQNNFRGATIGVFVAVAAGLIPVVFANQSSASGDSYETRFFIPVLPFAAIATIHGAFHLARQRFWPWVAAILVFISVCTVFNSAFDARREQLRMVNAGELIKPLVRESGGMTIVVVPDFEKLDGADITPKVTKNWPIDLVRRIWVLPLNQAVLLFGSRTKCVNTTWIDLKPGFLSAGRRGPVSHLIFIQPFWKSPPEEFSSESLENYCVPTVSVPQPR